MLINLRNALMAGTRLPYDAEVEYLEGTGTQYIDTGLDAQSCEIRCDFDLGGVNTYETVFGVQSPANNFLEARRYANNTSLQVAARNLTTTVALQSGRNSFVGIWDSSGCSGTLNGTAFSVSSGAVVGSAGYHIFLFAANQDKAPAYYLRGKIYFFQMRVGGVLAHDLIPVRKGTVGYLYDRVSGKLFGNAGTGDFVLGPDVVQVEYIESHGTEYIDTGVIGTDVGTLEMRLKKTDANGTRRFILNSARNPQPVGSSVYFDVNASGYFGQASNGYECIVGQWYDIEIVRDVGYYFDGTLRISPSFIFPFRSANNLLLFWVSDNNKFIGQISALKIYDNNDISVRNLLSVRVGNEGAMMDVLTRRIYRNAGTGAFTYGNDLKYPIPSE